MKTKSKSKAKTRSTSKVINPQRILDAKAELVKKAGGSMKYAGKAWTVKVKGREKVLSSREMARFNVPTFAKTFRLPFQARA